MFNPFSFQGGTAIADPQAVGTNGQARMPEFLGAGIPQILPGAVQYSGVPITQPTYFGGIPGSAYSQIPVPGYIPGAVGYTGPISSMTPGYPTIAGAPQIGFNPIAATPYAPFIPSPVVPNPFITATPYGFASPTATPFGQVFPQFATTPFGAPIGMPGYIPFNPITNFYGGVVSPLTGIPSVNPGVCGPTINPFVGPASLFAPTNVLTNPVTAYNNPLLGIAGHPWFNPMLNGAPFATPWAVAAACSINGSCPTPIGNFLPGPLGVSPFGMMPYGNSPFGITNPGVVPTPVVPGAFNPATVIAPSPFAVHHAIASLVNNPFLASRIGMPVINPFNPIGAFNPFNAINPINALNPYSPVGLTHPWVGGLSSYLNNPVGIPGLTPPTNIYSPTLAAGMLSNIANPTGAFGNFGIGAGLNSSVVNPFMTGGIPAINPFSSLSSCWPSCCI